MLKPPTEQEIFNFTSATHSLDRIDLSGEQIINTWYKKGSYSHAPNPFAQGHFRALMYIIHNLIPSIDFPVKEIDTIQSIRESDSALYWLRELHNKMADPLVNHAMTTGEPDAPIAGLVGRYRIVSKMAVSKPCPPPDAIPQIMHNWLVDYSRFHNSIKGKIDNPYGFDKETAYGIINKAFEVNLFFCLVQPMSCLNQRMGRILENAFRLMWNLPMKIYTRDSEEANRVIKALQDYEEKLPALVTAARSVKG